MNTTHTTEPTAAEHRCDQQWSMLKAFGDDGHVRCWRHMTPAERELSADLDRQAPAYGVLRGCWPYGPNIDLYSRARMIAWASDRGVKLAHPSHICPCWLLSGQCPGYCQPWLDHQTAWHSGWGRNPVLVAHTYGMVGEYLRCVCLMAADGFDIRVSAPANECHAPDDPDATTLAAAGVRILPPGQSWYSPDQTRLVEARPTRAAMKQRVQLNRRYRAAMGAQAIRRQYPGPDVYPPGVSISPAARTLATAVAPI